MMVKVNNLLIPIFFGLCLLLGGASNGGFFENLLLQVLGVLLVLLIFFGKAPGPHRLSYKLLKWLTWFWAAAIFLQFVPLPLSLWSSLPGRGTILEELRLLGLAPSPATLTLSVHDSVASLVWILPAICLAVALVASEEIDPKRLGYTLLACTFIGLALGLLQFLSGPDSNAYLYRITNRGLLVGFFANANHMATLLLTSLPFLAALTRAAIAKRPDQQRELLIIWLLLTGLVIIGILLVGSLTGYALAGPVIALSTIMMFPQMKGALKFAIVPGVVLGLAVIAFTDEGGNVFEEEASLSAGGRQQIFSTTLKAVSDFWPAGSGIGTFRDIYDNYEPQDAVTTTYINHAHNDYLEIALELGLMGVLGVLGFLAWWLFTVWGLRASLIERPFVYAAAISSGTILVHSLWDYPLRTAAIGAVFALSCAILAKAKSVAGAINDRAEAGTTDKGHA